jgi:glycosyltransferase involved in cell wall biosynthesis
MTSPLVSVVIATYNSGHYLSQAIESVLQQTVNDLEVIVIDDGSTDGPRNLVASIDDPRLRYVWQANAGQTVAKNHGARLARGEFVAFCDGDDFWYENKLELQLPLFSKSPSVAVVYSPADTIDEHGHPLGDTLFTPHRGTVTHALFMRNFVPFGTAVVRRRCLEEVGGFDESLRMGIDWDLWLRISVRHQFDYVEQSTYAYRIWQGQMSKNWRGRYSSAFRIMNKFVDEHPNAIPSRLRRHAFADTFANRARARQQEQRWAAIGDAMRALVLHPTRSYIWKTLGRVVVDSVTANSSDSRTN